MPYSNFPRRLVYLRPVLEQLARIPTCELNEDVDTSVLDAAFRMRIEGLPSAKARRLLAADIKSMASWMNKCGGDKAAAHFVLGWLAGAKGALLGPGDQVVSLLDMLSDLPPPPPGREFGPLPSMHPFHGVLSVEGSDVYFYIRTNANKPTPVDIQIAIDGDIVVQDAFETDNVFTRYHFRLPQGQHHLVAESERGQARIEEDIFVHSTLHVGIAYWYAEPGSLLPELPPQLTLHAAQQPWIPDHGWRPNDLSFSR